jgi:zinc transport system substrate-binding protein
MKFYFSIFLFTLSFASDVLAEEISSGSVSVMVSIKPQVFLVERICGNSFQVSSMVPEGVFIENYEPTIAQVKALNHADLYIKIGHPKFEFESSMMNHYLESAEKMLIVNSLEGATLIEEDPHPWTSPELVLVMADNIAKSCIQKRPNSADAIENNKAKFVTDLKKLQSELRATFKEDFGKSFIVGHPAWGYFAKEFGLKQVAIENEGKEPGIAQLMELVDLGKSLKIKTIFIQPGEPMDAVKIVANGLGAKVETISPMEVDLLSNLRNVSLEIKNNLR